MCKVPEEVNEKLFSLKNDDILLVPNIKQLAFVSWERSDIFFVRKLERRNHQGLSKQSGAMILETHHAFFNRRQNRTHRVLYNAVFNVMKRRRNVSVSLRI